MPQSFPWNEVSDLLDAAMSLPSAERPQFLASACHDDALRQYMQSLVLSFGDSASFLEQSPRATETGPWQHAEREPGTCAGRKVGPYLLIEEIGSGGMGMVYRAIRADDQYLKSVAIKLMKGDFSSQFSLMRFRVERQIMASLDHPNIARLLDGGATDDGLPYLVMELIEGQPIDFFCDLHRLSTTERLKLFRGVCSAVHYAHQHLVIHRDLKPRNVLVTEEGVVKLLDFGIAKILDPETFPQAVEATIPLMRLLSPEYASPEQVRGDAITTASDVYSLGVLLYELLTGHKPYSFNTASLTDLTSVVCHAQPSRPSDVIGVGCKVTRSNGEVVEVTPASVCSVRDGHPGKLRKRLQGDLDNIVLKALRKEPERRYQSVEQFSADIQRHLDGLPVNARTDTLAYRTTKFIRRHTALVASAVLITLSLLIGITLTWREAQIAKAEKARAVRRFNDVRDLARSNLFELFEALQAVPGSAPAQHLAIRNALKYLDELNAESGGDRELTAELSNAYEKIGDLQGAYRGAGIGDSRAALESYSKALRLQEQLIQSSADNGREMKNEVGLLRKYVRSLLHDARTGEASAMATRAVDMAERLAAQDPADAGAQADLAQAHLRLAWVMAGSGTSSSTRQVADAVDHDRRAVAILTRLSEANDATAKAQLPRAELMLGFHLSRAREFQEAGRTIDSGIAGEQAQLGLKSGTLVTFYNFRGLNYEREGNHRKALEDYKRSLPLARSLAAADPRDLDAQLGLEVARGHVAVEQARLGRAAEGLPGIDEAVAGIERMYAADPAQSFYQSLLTIAYAYQAELLSATGDQEAAKLRYEKALRTAERIAAADPLDLESRLSAAKLHLGLAVILIRQSRYAEATSRLTQSLAALDALLKERPQDPEALYLVSTVRSYLPAVKGCVDRRPCSTAAQFQLPILVN